MWHSFIEGSNWEALSSAKSVVNEGFKREPKVVWPKNDMLKPLTLDIKKIRENPNLLSKIFKDIDKVPGRKDEIMKQLKYFEEDLGLGLMIDVTANSTGAGGYWMPKYKKIAFR